PFKSSAGPPALARSATWPGNPTRPARPSGRRGGYRLLTIPATRAIRQKQEREPIRPRCRSCPGRCIGAPSPTPARPLAARTHPFTPYCGLGFGRRTRRVAEDSANSTARRPNAVMRPKAKPQSGFLGALGAVLGPCLLAVLDPLEVERAAHDVVAHARQVLDPAAANQHDRVFLQVVAFTTDIADDLEAVGQADFRHLAQRRVRLLRGRGVHAGADATTLRAVLQGRALALDQGRFTDASHELVDGGHPGLPET